MGGARAGLGGGTKVAAAIAGSAVAGVSPSSIAAAAAALASAATIAAAAAFALARAMKVAICSGSIPRKPEIRGEEGIGLGFAGEDGGEDGGCWEKGSCGGFG